MLMSIEPKRVIHMNFLVFRTRGYVHIKLRFARSRNRPGENDSHLGMLIIQKTLFRLGYRHHEIHTQRGSNILYFED